MIIDTQDAHTIIFNGISRNYIVVSSRFLGQYIQILECPDRFVSIAEFIPFVKKLSCGGFIVDDNTDELTHIRQAYEKEKKEKVYSLLIMSTYACNFRCWYCVQHHQDMEINDEVACRMKKHISRYLIENDIKYFDLSWFGGEPILNMDAIEDVSSFALNFCDKNQIEFNCGITTNGSLLTESIVKKMRELRFKDFQITIDGGKEYHNKTKKNALIDNSFDLILHNVVLIVQNLPEAKVTLRINYTHNNITSEFPKQVDSIAHVIKDKIALLFRLVWQEREIYHSDEHVNSIIEDFRRMGYYVEHDFNDPSVLSCYVEKEHFLSIFPNGAVDNCNNKPLIEARGYINDDGVIVWNKKPSEKSNNIFETKSDCIKCKYLPICMGPCPAARENVENDGFIRCNVKDRDNFFKRHVVQFCRISNH